jgi:hypothetical protein
MPQPLTGSTGDLAGVGSCDITLSGVGNRAGAAWLLTQRGPYGGLVGCPMDPGMPSLRLIGVARPSFGCP